MAKVISNYQVRASAQWIKRYVTMLRVSQDTSDYRYMVLSDELRVFNNKNLGVRRYKKPGRKMKISTNNNINLKLNKLNKLRSK